MAHNAIFLLQKKLFPLIHWFLVSHMRGVCPSEQRLPDLRDRRVGRQPRLCWCCRGGITNSNIQYPLRKDPEIGLLLSKLNEWIFSCAIYGSGSGFLKKLWNFGDQFFCTKTSWTAMKHVTNEGGGHVWSFLGTFVTYLSSSTAEVFMVWLCAVINPLFNTLRSFWVTLEEDMMRGRTILTLLFPAHSLPTYSFCVWHEIACLNIVGGRA